MHAHETHAHEMRDAGNFIAITPRPRNRPPNTRLAATLSLNALERYADKYLGSGNNGCLCLTCNRQHLAAPAEDNYNSPPPITHATHIQLHLDEANLECLSKWPLSGNVGPGCKVMRARIVREESQHGDIVQA
jgi:hypothetical protein